MLVTKTESLIRDIINEEAGHSCKSGIISFSRFADISTSISFALAPVMKRSPNEIADIISGKLNMPEIRDVEILNNGFINIFFKESALRDELYRTVQSENYGAWEKNGKKVNIEFISANPTGPLVLVNARAGFTGALLKNMMNYSGYDAHSEYYVNDGGNQIRMLGMSILYHIARERPSEFPRNGYRGDYVQDIAQSMKAKHGLLEWNDDNIELCSDYGKNTILQWQKESLRKYSIVFDNWVNETDIRNSGAIENALEFLNNHGLTYEKDNALFFRSTRFYDDKDRVVVKSDGTYSYLLPDIAYHYDKIQRGYSILIDILGPDHHGYIDRIRSAVHAQSPETQMEIVIAQLVTLYRNGQQYEMSKRQGEFITLDELYEDIDADVLKFMFLMRKLSQPFDFDIEEAKKQTMDNPVYYVQYAHARICSVLSKAGIEKMPEHIDNRIFNIPEARELMVKMMEFPFMVYNAAQTYEVHRVGNYLYDLAGLLHKFYHNHRIISDDTEDMNSKAALLMGVKRVIAAGLNMMNVTPKERMENSEIQ